MSRKAVVLLSGGLDSSTTLAIAQELLGLSFEHLYIQLMDGPDIEMNAPMAAQYCLDHPEWKLSLQVHKLLNIA